MIFKHVHGKANPSTLIEHKTHYAILLQNPDRKREPLIGAIQDSLQAFPGKASKTITFDRGTEFASYRKLRDQLDANIYFYDPHSLPSRSADRAAFSARIKALLAFDGEKGSAENSKSRVRRFLSSETKLTALAAGIIETMTGKLNNMPRKCLGYRTQSGGVC